MFVSKSIAAYGYNDFVSALAFHLKVLGSNLTELTEELNALSDNYTWVSRAPSCSQGRVQGAGYKSKSIHLPKYQKAQTFSSIYPLT